MTLDIKMFITYFLYTLKPYEKCFKTFNISATVPLHGGETASTEIKKFWLHTEILSARKKGGELI